VTRELRVLGAGVWTPCAPTLASFLAGEAQLEETRPEAQLLTARMRGRASLLTAMFANVAEQAARNAGLDARALPSLFGSAYGEMGTIRALLAQLSAAGDFSPARFQASVHNTAAGQLSIALGNRSFSSSIAAGHDTLAMLWIEACAFLHDRPGRLLVACADEGASPELQPGLTYLPLAAAWVVSNVAEDCALARLGWPSPVVHSEPGRSSEQENPCAPALALTRSMFSGERCAFALNRGFQLQVQSLAK
jgi:hypothetical protein